MSSSNKGLLRTYPTQRGFFIGFGGGKINKDHSLLVYYHETVPVAFRTSYEIDGTNKDDTIVLVGSEFGIRVLEHVRILSWITKTQLVENKKKFYKMLDSAYIQCFLDISRKEIKKKLNGEK